MTERIAWKDVRRRRSVAALRGFEDEARVSEFREVVFRLRSEAGLTQAELAERMGTTQSAIARMEGGGTRPTLETLEKRAIAVRQGLVVGDGSGLSENQSMAQLFRDGRAVVRRGV